MNLNSLWASQLEKCASRFSDCTIYWMGPRMVSETQTVEMIAEQAAHCARMAAHTARKAAAYRRLAID